MKKLLSLLLVLVMVFTLVACSAKTSFTVVTTDLEGNETTHKIKTERGSTEETTEFRVAVPGGTVDRAGLRQLTAALKELQTIKGEVTDLERREREARIDALRRSSMTADGDDDDTGIILLPPRREADADA